MRINKQVIFYALHLILQCRMQMVGNIMLIFVKKCTFIFLGKSTKKTVASRLCRSSYSCYFQYASNLLSAEVLLSFVCIFEMVSAILFTWCFGNSPYQYFCRQVLRCSLQVNSVKNTCVWKRKNNDYNFSSKLMGHFTLPPSGPVFAGGLGRLWRSTMDSVMVWRHIISCR